MKNQDQTKDTKLLHYKKDQISSMLLSKENQSISDLEGSTTVGSSFEISITNTQSTNKWIYYSLGAAVICALNNSIYSEISQLGFQGLFYTQPGSVVCGIAYFTYSKINSHLSKKKCESLFSNLTNNTPRRVNWYNVKALFYYALIFLIMQVLQIITFTASIQANINTGIVTAIWATTPLFAGLLDYFLFGVRLSIRHFLGVACLLMCVTSISLSSFLENDQTVSSNNDNNQAISPLIPLLLAFISTPLFAANNIQTKYLTTSLGFQSTTLQFQVFTLTGVFLSIIFLPQIMSGHFPENFLILGTISSILQILSLIMIAKACQEGPIGPAVALINLNSILFTILECAKTQKIPNVLEISGLLIGFIGALIISVPNISRKLLNLVRCQRAERYSGSYALVQ